MQFGRRVKDPDEPSHAKAWAAAAGVALTIASFGLITWMAMDVDGDGRASYSEFRSGTSPFLGDTDGDGVADGYELDHGFDALSAGSVPPTPSPPPLDVDGDEGACSIAESLVSDCSAPAEGSGDPQDARDVPSGGSGAAATSILGIATSVLASVGGRMMFRVVAKS